MTELERLEQNYQEKRNSGIHVEQQIKTQYTNIINSILSESGLDLNLINYIYIDLTESFKTTSIWNYDRLVISIGDNDNNYDISLYINEKEIKFNNCCTGDWLVNSNYHKYLKALVALADAEPEIRAVTVQFDRTPLEEEQQAHILLEREKRRLHEEEFKRIKEAKIQEIDSAEYIAEYRAIRSYEEGYVQGENKQKVGTLYKVIKRTPKFITCKEYERSTDDKGVEYWHPSNWLNDQVKMRRDSMYYPNYKKVSKGTAEIIISD